MPRSRRPRCRGRGNERQERCAFGYSVWLLLDGGRDAVRRPGLGFLGTSRFRCENPGFWGLDFLGFPWILSSESIDINGLHEIFRAKFFLAPFVGAKEPSERPPTICHERRMDRSWGKLTSVSDFRQEIAARAASFRPPPSKSKSLQLDCELSGKSAITPPVARLSVARRTDRLTEPDASRLSGGAPPDSAAGAEFTRRSGGPFCRYGGLLHDVSS
jgi:hypothetical protein